MFLKLQDVNAKKGYRHQNESNCDYNGNSKDILLDISESAGGKH